MDSPMDDSIFDVGDASSDNYSPEPKPAKAKAVPKKAAAPKTKAAPKTTQTNLKTTLTAPKKRPKPESDEENSDEDGNSLHDDSLLSNTPPSAKKMKKAPAPKKSSGKPLQPIDNESFGVDGTNDDNSKMRRISGSKDKYQKLTQLEHILRRPDTYIGSVERTEKQMWVYNSETDSMESREVSFVPGLYKIFDEILVNAADNKQRDKTMDEIKVTVDREKGEISVWNNGRGIPIQIHEKEKIYIPEMIFGHLLTSSNYDDNEAKVTGGRNGYGAKLANVFSTEFTLETVDSKTKQKYKQTWTDNMSKMQKAKITSHSKGDDYTKVTFFPDFKKFGMDEMDSDFEALVKRRVYDMAGTCKGVKVSLNGDKIKVKSFKKYMEMYTKAIKTENLVSGDIAADASTQVILTDNPNERWEIGFAVSDGAFQQVSFVNSIATTSGGTHVNYIADQIVTKLMEIVKKKDKGGVQLKPNQIRNHLFLFVNSLIVNPAFTGQTKEQLTTKTSQFGSKCTLSDKFLKDIAKTEVVNNILNFAKKKADQVLKKSDGNRRDRMNHAKLTDANKAGTRDGHRCTLILTEGDSASLLALAGRAVVDPDLIGVFPLRGKVLNVRDASFDQISKNQEIQNIKKFMGLQHKKHYDDVKSLRYGHLMIMTDQDHDGSHIKGLLINFLEVSFPSLLKIPGFLQEFITPIVKVWKGDPKNPKKLKSFFTMPEYEAWRQIPGNEKGWDHKYFKGLGTSTTTDGEDYFRDLDRHLKQFHVMRCNDQINEPELIDLAFSKKKADARKEWLRNFVPGTYLDMTANQITYDDFINKELILFSVADNMRSIPSVVDGLKPGQRKVLYTCFRRNLKKDLKVVELAGSVSGLTAYAYGDTSLQQTIVGLAQTFVGSNNVNCLEPSGNFGSRLQGGSDCASARYIYTRLSPFARRVFHTKDEPLLTYNTDDGKTIEPEVYVPVLPMILVNGADGIGTGWSSSIPNYNPEDIVKNLKVRMSGSSKDDMERMVPWFRGWQGEVEAVGEDRFKFSGKIRQTSDNEVEITELPIRIWTQDFKEKLEEIIKAEKVPSFIKDYTEYNTPVNVHFVITMEDKHMKVSVERGLEETFKLSRTLATSNLVAFDAQNRIHKYGSELDILEEFFHVRLRYYEKRKEYMLNELNAELTKLSNQSRFIQMIVDNELVVSKKKKQALVVELRELGFDPIPRVTDARKKGEFEDAIEDENNEEESAEAEQAGLHDYDYLLGMAIWSLTRERIDKLMKQIGDKNLEIDILVKTSPKELWTTDLDEFLAEWHFQLEDEAKRAKDAKRAGRRASTKLKIGGKAGIKKRKNEDSDDSDFAVSKPKKAVAGKAKPSTLTNYFSNKDPQPPKPAAKNTLINAFERAPVARPPAEEAGLLDDAPDRMDVDKEIAQASKVTKPLAVPVLPPANPAKTLKQPKKDDDEGFDDVDDVFAELAAKEAKTKDQMKDSAPAGRQARAASRKPVKYALSDDSDGSDGNGDDLLGDVSNMVKGIPNSKGSNDNANGPPKALFSNSASRPSSSHGISTKPRPSKSLAAMSDEEDETDYKKLVPRDSPLKPAARNAREVVLSDDDEDSLHVPAPRAALKTSSVAKPAGAAAGKLKKPKLNEKPKSNAAEVVVAKEKKPAALSPAAKAYAAKQAKAKSGASSEPAPAQPKLTAKKAASAPPPTKKAAKKKHSSDDEDEDVDVLANDILDDSGDEVVSAAPAARPSRRAATTSGAKSKYKFDDEDEDEEEEDFSEQSEDDYDDDSE